MSCAESVVSLLATLDSLIKAPSSSFSSRWKHRARSWVSRVRARVKSRSSRIAAGLPDSGDPRHQPRGVRAVTGAGRVIVTNLSQVRLNATAQVSVCRIGR